MKKLLFLLLIPLVSFGQEIKFQEYYDNGKQIKEFSWQDNGQQKTLVEIGDKESYQYFINENDVEVRASMEVVREYGKYFKVDVSITNNSNERLDFVHNNIYVKVNGDVKKKEKYFAIPYYEYINKVERKQAFGRAMLSGIQGFNTGMNATQTTNQNGYQVPTYNNQYADIKRSQNRQEMKDVVDEQEEATNYINEGYLKNHTLFPLTQLEGYVLIPFHRKITDIDFIIKLGSMEFDFSDDKWNIPPPPPPTSK